MRSLYTTLRASIQGGPRAWITRNHICQYFQTEAQYFLFGITCLVVTANHGQSGRPGFKFLFPTGIFRSFAKGDSYNMLQGCTRNEPLHLEIA